jgi:hypothetical protein
LDAVFGNEPSAVSDRLRQGPSELPDDPSADQVTAWVELVELLSDLDYIEASRRMAVRTSAEGVTPDGGHLPVDAIGKHEGDAVRAGVDPASPQALAVIEHMEALTPDAPKGSGNPRRSHRGILDHRTLRYRVLVGVVNGWTRPPVAEDSAESLGVDREDPPRPYGLGFGRRGR